MLGAIYLLIIASIVGSSLWLYLNKALWTKIISFQNNAEKDFKHKKSLKNASKFFLAYITFFISNFAVLIKNASKVVFKKPKNKLEDAIIIDANENNLDLHIKEGVSLVEFWGDWCGPCLMMEPTIEEFSNSNNNIKIVKVNTKHQDIAMAFKVKSIPQFLLFRDNKEIRRKVGPMTLEELKLFTNI